MPIKATSLQRQSATHRLESRLLDRRQFCRQAACLSALPTLLTSMPALALMPQSLSLPNPTRNTAGADLIRLDPNQAQAFRSWVQLLVHQQLNKGANPRWQQRDCAGLIRFVCGEALQVHNAAWLKANGFLGQKVPPEVSLNPTERSALRHTWVRADGSKGAFVSAFELIQGNTTFMSKDITNAAVADLLFFDQGQAQHLMIWMGQYVAYHTGTVTPTDNGLRAYPLKQLMAWKDTRWQPRADNPNFLGIFRLSFLSAASL